MAMAAWEASTTARISSASENSSAPCFSVT